MITNVVDWVKCFSIYIAAMAQKYPEVTLPMLAYQLVIIKASQQYDGFYWRVYDTHYRVNAAATGNRNWAQLDTDLYTRFFTGRAPRRYLTATHAIQPPILICSAHLTLAINVLHLTLSGQVPKGRDGRVMYVCIQCDGLLSVQDMQI